MRRSTKRISGAAAALAVAAALALCGPAAYAAPAAPGDAQAPAAGAQPADGGPAAQADAAQPAQADSGDLATYFDVWYRVHVDNVGWLGWTKNGAVAGSTGYGTHVQAVQVRLTRKGANAPGSTVSPCLLGQPSAFANPMQKKIVDLARQVPSPGPGLCSEWIADIYERAGFRNVHTDACDYYWDYCKFTDYSQLKVGMVIAVPSHTHTRMGSIYGHVCLYIGNNQVMDNVGQIRTLDMAYWLDYYSTSYKPKWGWYDNVPLA